jgi:hypothetical protein
MRPNNTPNYTQLFKTPNNTPIYTHYRTRFSSSGMGERKEFNLGQAARPSLQLCFKRLQYACRGDLAGRNGVGKGANRPLLGLQSEYQQPGMPESQYLISGRAGSIEPTKAGIRELYAPLT